jgi:hypothetical protein
MISRSVVIAMWAAGMLMYSVSFAGADSGLACHCNSNPAGPDGYHFFHESFTLQYSCSPSFCHRDTMPYMCSIHYGCGPGGGPDPDFSEETLSVALSRADVAYNFERQALQLIDCGGLVAASYPLSEGEYHQSLLALEPLAIPLTLHRYLG